jgi:CRP-like cAMP-binding protein
VAQREPLDPTAALAASSVFAVLSEAARRRMASAGSVVRLDAEATLFERGDAGDAAYVVLDGELEAIASIEDGRSMRLATFGPGAIVGELAALDGEPRSASVRATRRAEILRIPRDAVLAALGADPAAALALMKILARRLRTADIALAVQAWGGLTEKLAGLLAAEAGASGLVAITQSEMARRLGVARENVNRRLRSWAEEGIVETTKAGVRVLRADRLAEAAGHIDER